MEGLDCKWSKSNLQRLRFVVYNVYIPPFNTLYIQGFSRFLYTPDGAGFLRINAGLPLLFFVLWNGGTSSPSSSCMLPRCQDLGMSEQHRRHGNMWGRMLPSITPWHHSETCFSIFILQHFRKQNPFGSLGSYLGVSRSFFRPGYSLHVEPARSRSLDRLPFGIFSVDHSAISTGKSFVKGHIHHGPSIDKSIVWMRETWCSSLFFRPLFGQGCW